MLNSVTLIGRLGQDPEIRYSTNGVAICSMSVATDGTRKQDDGKYETVWVPVKSFGKLAENCANHLGKGRLVAVTGKLNIYKYEKDGTNRIGVEVVADNVRFLDYANKE